VTTDRRLRAQIQGHVIHSLTVARGQRAHAGIRLAVPQRMGLL
jgi:hypothetical protein